VNRVIGTFILALLALGAYSVPGQKAEHYNSPLYSPRYYDPNESQTNGMPEALQKVGIDQKLGEQLPLETEVKDESGKMTKIGDYFKSGRPAIIAFVYYECPMLCNEVLNGLTGSLKGISLDAGKDFDVIAISFDARENDKPDLAKNKKASYMERYGRPGTESGWHFLTATQGSIDKLTNAAGYKYEWDDKTQQFAHVGGLMIATPDGKLSRYFYGIDYAPRDLKYGLMESAEAKIGTPAERLLLYCYHYDPASGKYGLAILRVLRLASVLTIAAIGAMLFIFWRRNKSKQENLNENDGDIGAAAV